MSAGTAEPGRPLGRIDQFRLERKLGSGAQGEVYAAMDLTLRRPVAIKILRGPAAESDTTRARFLREAQVLASLDHPAIVRIFHAGPSSMGPYYAMEYLARGSLDAWLARGHVLDSAAMAQLLKDILPGIGTMHDHGILHRDLKPGNVLFNDHGRAKIADFGLVLDERSKRLSQTDSVVGTPNYLAPEQWQGQQPTPQADFYAVGVITYEALTGDVPFRSDTFYALSRTVCEEPPDYAPVRALPDGEVWQAFLVELLAKHPDERPQSAWAILNRLNRLVSDLRVPTIESSPPASWSALGTSMEDVRAAGTGPGAVSRVRKPDTGTAPTAARSHRSSEATVMLPESAEGVQPSEPDRASPSERRSASGAKRPAGVSWERVVVLALAAALGLAVLVAATFGASLMRARGELNRLQAELDAAKTDLERAQAERLRLARRNVELEGQTTSLLNAQLPDSEPIVLGSQVTKQVDGALCFATFERAAPDLPHLAVQVEVANTGSVPLPGHLEVTLYDHAATAIGRARLPLDSEDGAAMLQPGERVRTRGSVRVVPQDAEPVRFSLRFPS